MTGTALVTAERNGLEHKAAEFAAYLGPLLDKVHRFYGFKTGKNWLAGKFNSYNSPGLSLKTMIHSDGYDYIRLRAFICTSFGFDPIIPTPDTDYYFICEDRHAEGVLDAEKAYLRRRTSSVLLLSQIDPASLNEGVADIIAQIYGASITKSASSGDVKVKRNFEKLEDIQALIKAVILDPDLEPEDFFTGYQRAESQADYIPLELDVPDIQDEQSAYDKALAKLDDPRGIDLASFGDKVSMRAAQAASAIDDWHMNNNHQVPKSFRLMRGLSEMVAEFKREDGSESIDPENLARRYRDVGRQIKALRASIPKEMEDIKKFLEDSGDASRTLQVYATVTNWYKDGFQGKMNDLQTMTVHADSDLPRFQGDFLSVKMANLRKSAIIRQQKATEMDHITTPTYQAVYMTLSEMQLEIEQIDRSLQKAARSELLRQMKRQSRSADFNFSAYGLRISRAEIDQFYGLKPDQQDTVAERDHAELVKAASKWDKTIEDAEAVVLQIENGTAQPLMLSYEPSADDADNDNYDGTIRLQVQAPAV